jgi:hypothetical protein
MKRATTAGVVVLLGVGLAGGTAVAASKPPASVKACVNIKGVLSLITNNKCAKGSHSLSIAVKGVIGKTGKTGASGLPGPAGAVGAPGAAGQRGPSDLYFVDHRFDGSSTILDVFSDPAAVMPTTVASVDVPAGTYSVNGTVHAFGATTGQVMECMIVAQVGGTASVGSEYPIDTDVSNNVLAAAGVVSLSGTGTISLRCGGSTGSAMIANIWTLQAIQVGTAHGTVDQPLARSGARGLTG